MLPPLPRCSGWASSSLVSPNRVLLPRKGCRVGLHIVLFEACSAYRGRDGHYWPPPAQIRTRPTKASGLYGAFIVKGASRHFGRPFHSILLFDPRREHSSVPTAYFHRRRAQRRSRTALLQRRRRLVLD